MILEIAELTIKPGAEAEFLSNAANGVDIFRRAKGCRGMQIRQSPEQPGGFRLLVLWETLESHTVDFRGSAEFKTWLELTVPSYGEPPVIKNWSVALEGFGFAGLD
jgi:heme-degrading monooxygenase HmoA